MSNKHIILAHGRNGEMGVSTEVDPRGLPWPSLQDDIDYLNRVTRRGVLFLGSGSIDIAGRFLSTNDRKVFGISGEGHKGAFRSFSSIQEGVMHAENWFADRDIWFGGGAKLAASAFRYLELEGKGDFHETVIDADYPQASVHMPPFDEEEWSEPETIAEFSTGYSLKGRRTSGGVWLPEPTPAYRVQIRHVK